MQGTRKIPSGNLKDMFQPLFRISSICGLFPFVFRDNDLILSFYFLLHSILNLVVANCTVIYLLVSHLMHVKFITLAFTFSYIIPFALSLIVTNVSLFWLMLNLKKLRKVFRALRVVYEVTQMEGQPTSRNQHLILCLGVVALLAVEVNTSPRPLWSVLVIYWMSINVCLVMLQFTTTLATIGACYSTLRQSLRPERAAQWAQCHEVLGACCQIVNRCYSPQLFIFTLSSFNFITSTIYILVANVGFFSGGSRIMAMTWVSLVSLTLWAFIHHCHDTVEKAKNFDKALYKLVLNDSSKCLLRNKRILYHFQAKRKLEFSAMGFFNFDYSLICRMVSTATTYIVIMVQFTP